MAYPRDTLNISCFVEALHSYVESKTERDRAMSSYEGYSWGYHGSCYEDEVAIKAASLEDQLNSLIEKRVVQKLIELGIIQEGEDLSD